MNEQKIAELWTEILKEIGEKPSRAGLKDTPKRIARMYKEIFSGYDKTQKPTVTTFPNGKDGLECDEMICDEGTFYSHCEHHLVPFFGKYYFAYIPNPNGKILGLSKVARVVDYFSARVQVQERLVHDIVEYLWKELTVSTPWKKTGRGFKEREQYEPLGMALVMRGEHLCKTMRGVKKKGEMTCSVMKGAFKDEDSARAEFLNLIK